MCPAEPKQLIEVGAILQLNRVVVRWLASQVTSNKELGERVPGMLLRRGRRWGRA
jgi:hypothetical protein